MTRSLWHGVGITVLTAALALAACATAPVVSAPTVAVVCPPITTYTAAQETAMAQALSALPTGSPLATAMADYGKLRAAARACAGK